jgi:hypothetical protein
VKKILILIIASNDLEHEKDLLSQKSTWASRCPQNISVIFLRGWKNDFFFLDKGTLYVPCREEYSLILTKTILGMNYVLENFDFDILIRSNVSTYFESKRLNKELSKSIYNSDFFGGYFDQANFKHSNQKERLEYVSGAGLFLSRAVVAKLSKLNPEKYAGIADDIAMSEYLNDQEGIISIRIVRNNLHYTHFFIPTFYIRTKNSFDFKSASRRMILIDKYFRSDSISMKIRAYFQIQKNEFREYRMHPEGFVKFLSKNRVVFWAFLKAKFFSKMPAHTNNESKAGSRYTL